MTDTDRDKYCVNQIISFYSRQKTDYADYFQTAWRFRLVRMDTHLAVAGRAEAHGYKHIAMMSKVAVSLTAEGLRELYDHCCQVCGERFDVPISADFRPASEAS